VIETLKTMTWGDKAMALDVRQGANERARGARSRSPVASALENATLRFRQATTHAYTVTGSFVTNL
jgi:hypothetical protein